MAQEVAVKDKDADFFSVPFDNKSTALALKENVGSNMAAMDSIRSIFEEMRDSLNTLVQLTKQSLMPSKDDMIGAADVKSGVPKEEGGGQGGGDGSGFEIPKPGPKVGLVLMLAGLAALFKYGDQIAKALEPVLKLGKFFFDMLSPTGKIYLGMAGLAALLFPKALLLLVTGVGKGTIMFAFKAMKVAFGLMQAFMAGEFITKLEGTYIGQGIMKAIKAVKAAFLAMKVFLLTTVPDAIKGSFVGQGIMKAILFLKQAFLMMKAFLLTTVPDAIKGSFVGQGIMKAIKFLKEVFVMMKVFLLTTVPDAIKGSFIGQGIMAALAFLKKTFLLMKVFLLTDLPAGIASSYIGVGFTKALKALKAAFIAMQFFLLSTMAPTLLAMMAPFAIPIAAVVAAVAAAVAIFYAIKDGIDEFKKSLDEGDSMLVAIIEGVSTALLSLVTLPVTLIKNFVAWVADKLGFEGVAEKLREFSIVDFIKNSVKSLVFKAVKFVQGLFNIDFKALFGKMVDIGKSIMVSIKAIGAGALAAAKGFLNPVKNFKKGYNEYMEKNKLPDPEPIDIPVEDMEKITPNIDEELIKVQKEANLNRRKSPQSITTIDNSTVKGGDSITQDNYNQVEFGSTHTDDTAILAVAGSLANQ